MLSGVRVLPMRRVTRSVRSSAATGALVAPLQLPRKFAMSGDTLHAEAKRTIAPTNRIVAVGDALPDLALRLWRGGEWIVENSRELFRDRRVIVFGLPGAFTPTCSSEHLPRFEELAPALYARGVNEIVCTSVNDP
jgi:hypothetical protein